MISGEHAAFVVGDEHAVVVLHVHAIGLGRALHQHVHVLTRRIARLLRRRVVRAHAKTLLSQVLPPSSVHPQAAGGEAQRHAVAVGRVHADGVDARQAEPPGQPFAAALMVPQLAVQHPGVAVVGGLEHAARDGAHPQDARLIVAGGRDRPHLLQLPLQRLAPDVVLHIVRRFFRIDRGGQLFPRAVFQRCSFGPNADRRPHL